MEERETEPNPVLERTMEMVMTCVTNTDTPLALD